MNIMLQSAGIVVMIVIFIFYFNDRQAAVKSNRLFLYQAIAIFVSLILDITSLVLINTPGLTDAFITRFICKLYLADVIVVAGLGLLYVVNDSKLSKKALLTFNILGPIALAAGFVCALALHLDIVYDPGLNDYTGGASVIVTYIFTFVFMGITVATTIVKRKQIYKKRVLGVLLFIGIWTLGAAIQGIINYIFSDLGVIILSVSFAEAMGSLVIYIMLENPSFNLDRVTGALNQRALKEYLQECYDKNKIIELILIDYDDAVVTSIMGYDSFAKAITDLLREFGIKKIFKNDNNKFVIVKEELSEISLINRAEDFKQQIYRRNNIKSEIPFRLVWFRDISLFFDAQDIIKSLNYIVNNKKFDTHQIIDVDKDVANKIHKKFIMDKKCDVAFFKRNVEVFYQPIYSNNDLSFTSAEALVRLRDEDGNLIYPGDFIEEMEKDGRIVELGKLVFEDVCKFISENDMEKLGLHYIEVNLSAVQCMQEDLAMSYIQIMKKYDLNPKYINLEITETAQSTREILLKNMKILREYGVSFSLDDFGTGNSNLNYIVEMPVDIVKFDKNMVNSYFENRIASFVMNSTIDMIKGLGHKIVFEGVEKESQIQEVKQMRVDYVQGYFYSKPIDKFAFITFVIENN